MASEYANPGEQGVRNLFTVHASCRDQVEAIIIAHGSLSTDGGTVVKKPINEEEVTNE